MKYAEYKSAESGSTIMMVLGTLGFLIAFVSLAVDYSSNVGRNAQRDRVFNTAVEIGDGCLELAFGSWRKLSGTVENPATSAFSNIPTPSPGHFPSFPNAQISNFKVQAVTPMIELSPTDNLTSILPPSEPPAKTTGPGTGTFSYFYLASVDVRLPAQSGNLTAKVRRVFEKRYTSAWNWAILYNGDLELHPESPLALDGWVHTNGNAYIGNGATPPPSPTPDADGVTPDPTPFPTPPPMITLSDRLTFAGSYLAGYHSNDPRKSTHTNIADAVTPADLPPGSEQVYYPFGWTPSSFDTADTNPNNDGFREMIERPVGTDDVNLTHSRLYNQAGIVVEISDSGDATLPHQMTIRGGGVPDGTRTGVFTSQPSSNTVQREAWDIAAAALGADTSGKFTGTSFQDGREGGAMNVINVDVSRINATVPSNTKAWNGIFYITDTRGGTSKRGIRLINGSTVPGQATLTMAGNKKRTVNGITVVSENPVYIKGDFNTGRTGTTETPSNVGNFEDPEAGSYKRRPASVMADAVTLLSNNWNDLNAGAGLSSRLATNTTVNAAIVAGNVPTSSAGYSGGAENFVRFLEDWTGKTFTYYGAMMNMYASKQATGLWGKLGVDAEPSLKWFFDKNLSVDSDGNPVSVPGYVSTVAYLQQQRWYLQFD